MFLSIRNGGEKKKRSRVSKKTVKLRMEKGRGTRVKGVGGVGERAVRRKKKKKLPYTEKERHIFISNPTQFPLPIIFFFHPASNFS